MVVNRLLPELPINHWLAAGALLLYPSMAVTVKHGAGLIIFLMILSGFRAWSQRHQLTRDEKTLFWGFFFFLLTMLLSMVYTDDIREAGASFERYVHLPLAFFAYLYLRTVNIDVSRLLLVGITLAGFVYLATALVDLFWFEKVRAQGAYYAIIFGDMSAFLAFLLLIALWSMELSAGQQLIICLSMVCAVVASVMSATKGGWLFYPVGLVLLFVFGRNLISKKNVGYAVLLILSFALSFSLLKALNLSPTAYIEQQIESVTEGDVAHSASTFSARLSLWHHSLIIWSESPLLGTGMGDFRHDADELLAQGISYKRRHYGNAHNIVMHVLATAGLIGVSALLFWIFYRPLRFFVGPNIRQAVDRKNAFLVLGGISCVAAFFIFGMTEMWMMRNPFMRAYVLFLLFFIWGLSLERKRTAHG